MIRTRLIKSRVRSLFFFEQTTENQIPRRELGSVVSSSIGFDDSLYILRIDRAPERKQGMFVPSRTTDGHTYKVLTLDGDHMEELLLSGQKFNYHFVQPLGEDQLLLVGARCSYYGSDQYDLNGFTSYVCTILQRLVMINLITKNTDKLVCIQYDISRNISTLASANLRGYSTRFQQLGEDFPTLGQVI
ncbi:hypothetical protein E4V51_14150 [Paenibacillus sp. 28ISP30-2]|nr:hypothetical protein [Paenibacillus sp. 28ISP30-2]